MFARKLDLCQWYMLAGDICYVSTTRLPHHDCGDEVVLCICAYVKGKTTVIGHILEDMHRIRGQASKRLCSGNCLARWTSASGVAKGLGNTQDPVCSPDSLY